LLSKYEWIMSILPTNSKDLPNDWSGNNMSRDRLHGGTFKHLNLQGISLNGVDASEADFTGTNFKQARLQGANLRNTRLCETNLAEANLAGSDLRGAKLNGASLNGANLNRADLRGVKLNGADLAGANLAYAKLHDIDWSGADVRGTTFTECMGIKASEIEDLKERGANVGSQTDLPPPQLDWKWLIQFVVIPIVVASIGGYAVFANIIHNQHPASGNPIEQQKQR
jgi:hypothetical protein